MQGDYDLEKFILQTWNVNLDVLIIHAPHLSMIIVFGYIGMCVK